MPVDEPDGIDRGAIMHVTQGGELAVKNWLVNLDRHASIASALAEASCPVLVGGNSERIELDDATAPR